jgi:hypothetical protein
MNEHSNPADQKPPHLDRLSALWHGIFERKIVQWGAAYVAVAYAIQHGVVLTSDAFDWPHAITQISMLLLVLGLPVVITFAWYHGERESRNFTQAEVSILSALLVVAALLFYSFVRPSEQIATLPAAKVQEAGVVTARAASLSPGSAISIAVLPSPTCLATAARNSFRMA